MVLAFGDDLELDLALLELRRAGRPVPMEPQAFDVLAYLVSHRDRVVPDEELMDAVWGGRFVTEAAITGRIRQAREALGDDGPAQRLIRTVHGRGHRFVAPVEAGTARAGVSGPLIPAQRTVPSGAAAPVRHTTSDGLRIAYQVTGEGAVDIVLLSEFVSHLEHDWADPRHAHFLDRLGSMGRLIRFDKRGTGLSDRPPGVPDLETRMHDALAVMDAVGSRQAVLLGCSEGGPLAILVAAAHPERVRSLVLYGGYAKRTWSPDHPWGQTPEQRTADTDRPVADWDWEADLLMRCPSGDPAMQRWWAQRVRVSAAPSTVRALMGMSALVDVRDALPAVRVPTLVLHRTGDAIIRAEEARFLAEHIGAARLQLLDGADHFCAGDPDPILDAMEAFLDGAATPVGPASALAAVAATAGGAAAVLADQLVRAGGRRRTGPDARPVVLFDGPATAVRAGLASLRDDGRLGLVIAEVARDEERVGGYAVQLALEVADAAPPGTMWASASVGVLLAGSGVEVVPAGTCALPTTGVQPVLRAVTG